ncbi:hypothetical protein [Caballeronia sp. J97]|uniref:hypothetical protein n=1 Tax=Caballeronia sp. J97 TaxID=2805429 RepID=UPI002AB2AA68|nr:hypothetical protein [Caballeronia sp. J97]
MKKKLDQKSGIFAVGEIAAAWHFRDGFPAARSVPADFPVLTASLEHPDYIALDASLNADSPVSFASQLVPHPSATLRQHTLRMPELHVHWLSDPNAPEIYSAMQTWSNLGKTAFGLLLPDSAPYNCVFSTLDTSMPALTGTSQSEKAQSAASRSHDLMTAMVEVGNRLKRGKAEGKGASGPHHLVTVLLTSSIAQLFGHTGSIASAPLANLGANTLH